MLIGSICCLGSELLKTSLSLLTKGDICHLLITFANRDQDLQNVGPNLDSNQSLIVFLKEYFGKVNIENSQQMTTKA